MKPTQEQVIAWYEQANGWSPEGWDKTVEELERFATLAYEAGRKDENGACATDADWCVQNHLEQHIAARIRARREQ